MPFVNNQGVRIHYEVEGHGPPLVLVPGFTRNLTEWRLYGYVTALKEDYQLILVDARGHGESDKPHNPNAYGPELMTGDVVAVLNDLGVTKAHYWGYSMGGGIGVWLSRYYPARFSSYILGGSLPYPRSAPREVVQQPVATSLRTRARTILRLGVEEGPEAVIAFLEKTRGRSLLAEEKERIRNNDYQALHACFQRGPPPGFDIAVATEMLGRIAVPCLVYAGERDENHNRMKEAAQHIPDARFVSLPDLDHSPAYERSEFILPHVKRFLARVTR